MVRQTAGLDKEAGLDLTMMPFDSGKNIVESLAAYDWAVAGCGAVPALTTPLSDYLYIIAVANDESANNAIYVRKDSPSLEPRDESVLTQCVWFRCDRAKGRYPVSQSTSRTTCWPLAAYPRA